MFGHLGAIYWWERNLQAGGAWTQHYGSDDFHGAHHAIVADMDNDVVACAYYGYDGQPLDPNGRYARFENVNGDATQWTQHVVGEYLHGAEYVDVGDIDGDGDLDIIGTSWLTDGFDGQQADVYWFENDGGDGENWIQHTLALQYNAGHEAHAVDIDGDGDLDIITAQGGSPSYFTLWRNVNGDGSVWADQLIPVGFSGAGYLDIADIDGDGDMDIMGGGYSTGAIGFWRNNDGLGNNWPVFSLQGVAHIRAIELADMDGDGDLDALFCNNNGALWCGAWWLEHLSGNGISWGFHTIKNNFLSGQPWITAGDTDNDGNLEAVISIEDSHNNMIEQISTWQLSAYDTAEIGTLTSSILDGGISPAWSEIHWDATLDFGTSVEVQVRASNNPDDLGSFVSVPESGSDLSRYIDIDAQYFQYQVVLGAERPDTSPILTEIRVTAGQGVLVGDLDNDGRVGASDLLILLSSWGPCGDCNDCPADLDGGCAVGAADLLLLLSNWG